MRKEFNFSMDGNESYILHILIGNSQFALHAHTRSFAFFHSISLITREANAKMGICLFRQNATPKKWMATLKKVMGFKIPKLFLSYSLESVQCFLAIGTSPGCCRRVPMGPSSLSFSSSRCCWPSSKSSEGDASARQSSPSPLHPFLQLHT